ncbi:MAG: hypothetical protein AAF666_04390 [Pseudomonadota bacterium]
MLARGFHDAVTIWPVVFWPILISSCFFAYVRLCGSLARQFGQSPIGGRGLTGRLVTFGALPAAGIAELLVHAYMFYIVGYMYLVIAIPIYVFGWILIPWVLEGFRPGLTILALVHATFVAAFAVLMGFWDQNVLRALNSDLYGLLTGVPAAL